MQKSLSHVEVRQINRSLVLRLISRQGGASRAELSHLTGLTPAAISRITRELIDLGLIQEEDKQDREGHAGKRRTLLNLRPNGAHVIAVTLHASERSVALADLQGNVLRRLEVRLDLYASPNDTFDQITKIVRNLISVAEEYGSVVLGIGVSIAGVVDAERKLIQNVPQFGWGPYCLKDSRLEALGLPIFLENVNNILNLGEWRFGRAMGARHVFMSRISTFIGGSIISEGALLRGHSSSASQFGHMPIDDEGPICLCGRRGCLNTYASGLAILAKNKNRTWKTILQDNLEKSTQELFAILTGAHGSNKRQRKILEEAGEIFGRALTRLVTVLDPQIILLAGPLSRNDSYMDGVREGILANPSKRHHQMASLETSEMEITQATILTALDRFAFSPRLNVGILSALPRKRGIDTDSAYNFVETR